MSNDTHHALGASKHPAWAQCAVFDSKDEAGPAAERGTIQHKALECLLKNVPYDPEGKAPLLEDEKDGVMWALKQIRDMALRRKIESEITLEFFESDDDFEPLFFSTLDALVVDNQGRYGELFDYKSGEKRDYKNQTDAYAAMACQKYDLDYCNVYLLYGKTKECVQTRVERRRAEEGVKLILARRLDPNKKPNPCDYCGWCKHAATCPALNEQALAVAAGREDWKLETYHASEITKPEEMSKALKIARFMKNWAEAVEHHAKEMAVKDGLKIPGFTLGKRAGNRTITDAVAAQELSGLPLDEFLKCCNPKVTELEKKLGKAEFAKRLEPVLSRLAESVFLTTEKE